MNSIKSNKSANGATFPKSDPTRTACGIIALLVALIAVVSRFSGALEQNVGESIFGILGKVSVLLAVTWMAWPQLRWIQRLPGGSFAMVSLLVAGLVFVARPRLLLYVFPICAAAGSLFIALSVAQRFLNRPPTR